jgi:hypothetical protein
MVLLFAIRLAEGAAPRPTDARRCVTYATEEKRAWGPRRPRFLWDAQLRLTRLPLSARELPHSISLSTPGAEKAGVSDCLTCQAGSANWQRAICAAAIASARNAAFRRPSTAMRWSATSRSPSCVWSSKLPVKLTLKAEALRRSAPSVQGPAVSRSPGHIRACRSDLSPRPRRPKLLRFETWPCRSAVMIVLVRSCGRRKTFYRRS